MTMIPCLALFTDFGLTGPYMGQMRAALHEAAPKVPVIDLFADAPVFDMRAASYLLAAYSSDMGKGAIFVCVVDPGVGGERPPMILWAQNQVFVGPGNGLFEIVARRVRTYKASRITWRPDHLSASFHGRDLFAPVAGAMARGDTVDFSPLGDQDWRRPGWPDDLAEVIYVDHYGNVITGLRASKISTNQTLRAGGVQLSRAQTFGDVSVGEVFWYENANGLVEVSVNQGSAAEDLNLYPGKRITVA